MGAERRRGTCSDVSRGTWLKAPQGDTPRGRKVPDTDCDLGGNAQAEPDSESRIREIRPSGLMRGRNRSLRTNNCGRFNLVHPVPAYSTTAYGVCARADKVDVAGPGDGRSTASSEGLPPKG